MPNKILYKTPYSCIAIKDDKMYVVSTKYKDYSPRAITIMPGFQIELGRNINEIEEALKLTRVPVILKTLIDTGEIQQIQVIRMHTGIVNDKLVAMLVCKHNIIQSVSFNRDLIKDGEYRRYNQLSVYHQLSLPFDLAESHASSRSDQVSKLMTNIFRYIEHTDLEVQEDNKQLIALFKNDDINLKFVFISNKKNNSRFELMNISLI